MMLEIDHASLAMIRDSSGTPLLAAHGAVPPLGPISHRELCFAQSADYLAPWTSSSLRPTNIAQLGDKPPNLQVMSPRSSEAQGASTEETYAFRKNLQVPVEEKQQRDAARKSIRSVANRDEATLMSARESTPAYAIAVWKDESLYHTTGLLRRTLPMHDTIYDVFEEFTHHHD